MACDWTSSDATIKPQKPRLCITVRTWRWEVVTWIAGIFAVATIAILLFYFNNRPTSDWHSNLQPSTIIAALAQFAQAALLVSLTVCIGQFKWFWLQVECPSKYLETFDDASRVPHGSLNLLLLVLSRRRGRPPSTQLSPMANSTYNAIKSEDDEVGDIPQDSELRKHGRCDSRTLFLILASTSSMVLMLAFPTFIQQALSIRLEDRAAAGEAPTIGRAINHAPRWEGLDDPFFSFQENALGSEWVGIDMPMSAAIYRAMSTDTQSPSDLQSTCSTPRCNWRHFRTLAICPESVDESTSITRLERGEVHQAAKIELEGGRHFEISVDYEAQTFWSSTERLDTLSGDETWDSVLSDIIAETHLFYAPPCEDNSTTSETAHHHRLLWVEPSRWRAHRATWKMCLQTIKASFDNSSLTAKIVDHETGLEWHDRSGHPQKCAISKHDGQQYRFSARSHLRMHRVLAEVFNISARLDIGADRYVYTQWSPVLTRDVLGDNVYACGSNNSQLGFNGFTRRMNNVAISLSNS